MMLWHRSAANAAMQNVVFLLPCDEKTRLLDAYLLAVDQGAMKGNERLLRKKGVGDFIAIY
jgi:hypothetical protein